MADNSPGFLFSQIVWIMVSILHLFPVCNNVCMTFGVDAFNLFFLICSCVSNSFITFALWSINPNEKTIYIACVIGALLGGNGYHYPQDNLAKHEPHQTRELIKKIENQITEELEYIQKYYQLLLIKANDRSFEPHTFDSTIQNRHFITRVTRIKNYRNSHIITLSVLISVYRIPHWQKNIFWKHRISKGVSAIARFISEWETFTEDKAYTTCLSSHSIRHAMENR